MASDGSLLEGRGSTGWILAIGTGKISFEEIATGGAPVDCNPEENSSTRCELSGILASLAAIEQVTNGRANGLITAGCDSSAALAGVKKWLSQRFATRHMQAGSNSDLLREIRAVYRKLPRLHIKWVKVEAHLDRDPQTLHEVLNVEMDELADTVHFDPTWKTQPAAQTFESAIAEIIINKTRVTGDVGAALQRAYKADSMKTELIKTNGWERDLFDIIDWDNFGVVFRNMKEIDKIQLFKMSHGMLPVMRQQLRFEYATSNMCHI